MIAYLLLRMTINSNNELVPKLNNRLDRSTERVRAFVITHDVCMYVWVCIKTRVDMLDGPHGHKARGACSKLTVPKINPADSVVGEWVMVDMVREVCYITECRSITLRFYAHISGNLKIQWRWERSLQR